MANPITIDPWAPAPTGPTGQRDLGDFDLDVDAFAKPNAPKQNSNAKQTPHSFLGENSGLVNLDNLITPSTNVASPFLQPNPFSSPANSANSAVPNPFHQNQVQKPSINELRGATGARTWEPVATSNTTVDPWSPSNNLA